MLDSPGVMKASFVKAAQEAGLPLCRIDHELHPAPHKPPTLPKGKCGVYVFSLSKSYGKTCPAGSNRVLKVGKAGMNSKARFQYQHYKLNSARSTLAGSLFKRRILWPYLGITVLLEAQVEDWVKENTDRDSFFLDNLDVLPDLERYLRGILGPVFEGS